jgi:acetyl-CoA synthetase
MGGETMGLTTTGTTLTDDGTLAGTGAEPGTEAERIAFWEEAALRLDWEPAPDSQSPGQDKPWHTAHRLVPADV